MSYQIFAKPIFDLVNLYKSKKLELNPAFQRKSVWKEPDRKKLINSIMRGYPVPAIVLYKRQTSSGVIFDVIDGKQRLESILQFMGEMKGERYSAVVEMTNPKTGESSNEEVTWKFLEKRGLKDQIERFVFPVIEVEGEMNEIFNLFVRINSTGKPLAPQEKRKAIFYTSTFLQEAERIAGKFEKYFQEMEVLSKSQIDRMKDIEFVCELMLSLLNGGVLQKKTALNNALNSKVHNTREVQKASRLVVSALITIRKMFPNLRETRFCKVSDFYALVILIGEFQQKNLVLIDKRRNQMAWELLKAFGTGVDEIRLIKSSSKGLRRDQELFHKYWLTVVESTDEKNQRQQRLDILRDVLSGIFAKKDSERTFSEEQRRILWNTAEAQKCSVPGCTAQLTWKDFTVDHIAPHSRGGRTTLANAAIMCQPHNSAKGNRKTRTRRKSIRPRTKKATRTKK